MIPQESLTAGRCPSASHPATARLRPNPSRSGLMASHNDFCAKTGRISRPGSASRSVCGSPGGTPSCSRSRSCLHPTRSKHRAHPQIHPPGPHRSPAKSSVGPCHPAGSPPSTRAPFRGSHHQTTPPGCPGRPRPNRYHQRSNPDCLEAALPAPDPDCLHGPRPRASASHLRGQTRCSTPRGLDADAR